MFSFIFILASAKSARALTQSVQQNQLTADHVVISEGPPNSANLTGEDGAKRHTKAEHLMYHPLQRDHLKWRSLEKQSTD